MYLFHACRRLHPKVVTATVFQKGLFILFASSLNYNQFCMPDVCMCVFICITIHWKLHSDYSKNLIFHHVWFLQSLLESFHFFLRLSLESNWWNSWTKSYSIKLLVTAGVSNILCPFISMPSIDSSSPDYPFFPLCFLDISFSLINFFPLMLFSTHHFPLHLFLCHKFLSHITDFISLSDIYYTYILNFVDGSN